MAFRVGEPSHRAQLYAPSTLVSLACAASSGRRLGTGSGDEFSGRSAYEVLGVPETSSFSEIKASFRKLAKETHPDVSPSSDHAAATRRFLRILAAYEILSDAEKREHYDSFLLSQRQMLQKQDGVDKSAVYAYRYSSVAAMANQTEVVEWLKWYRLAVDDIISSRRIASSSGYLGELENELYSAIRAAYYGPVIESVDHLPDCFEAEERSTDETSELLHLVSGRDLLGIVYVADEVPELSHGRVKKLVSSGSEAEGSQSCSSVWDAGMEMSSWSLERCSVQGLHVRHYNNHVPDVYRDYNHLPDVYRDLEVHISGRIVATAARVPPKKDCSKNSTTDSDDHIHVFLSTSEDKSRMRDEAPKTFVSSNSVGSQVLLGTIKGLGTSPEEGSCFVYDNNGVKTHVIMKHRTLLILAV